MKKIFCGVMVLLMVSLGLFISCDKNKSNTSTNSVGPTSESKETEKEKDSRVESKKLTLKEKMLSTKTLGEHGVETEADFFNFLEISISDFKEFDNEGVNLANVKNQESSFTFRTLFLALSMVVNSEYIDDTDPMKIAGKNILSNWFGKDPSKWVFP
jgi:hypothetical protein